MKRIVIFMVLCFTLCLCFSTLAYAQNIDKEEEIDLYIKEKIVPVVVGVLTAVIALLTTLGSVAKSLNSLKDTKDTLSKEARVREEYSSTLKKEVEHLKEMVKDVPSLEEKINAMIDECQAIAQILSLGFSSNKEIIKSGKGREMSNLLEKVQSKRENLNNENN